MDKKSIECHNSTAKNATEQTSYDKKSKPLGRIKEGLSRYGLMILWVAISIGAAVAIQYLFSKEASCDFFDAKWEAGDILTYFSTVSLSLLTFWQNQKLNEENDKSQERLEQLSIRANELSVISKIIERENENIRQLRKARDEFLILSGYRRVRVHQSLPKHDKENGFTFPPPSMHSEEIVNMASENKQKLETSYITLCRELKSNSRIFNDDGYPLQTETYEVFEKGISYWNNVCKLPFAIDDGKIEDDYDASREIFITESEHYLDRQENLLCKIIQGNLSLSEINALYISPESNKAEDTSNGQT